MEEEEDVGEEVVTGAFIILTGPSPAPLLITEPRGEERGRERLGKIGRE